MRFKVSGLGAICAVALALPAWAHHSHTAYEATFIDLTGTVKEVHLVNPHSWVYIEVKDDKGQPQQWGLEASTPGSLQRAGITREYVRPGDTIKARCHPLRDKSNNCLLGFLQARDGSIKDWDGGANTAPVDDGFFDIKKGK